MEREVGGGIVMGNTCKPMAVSFQCMTKFTTNNKKKSNRIIYINRAITINYRTRLKIIENIEMEKNENVK